MSNVVIRNAGADLTGAGTAEVNQKLTHDGVGDVTLTLEGNVYHWSPNESKTLVDNLASQALAADNRLVEISRS